MFYHTKESMNAPATDLTSLGEHVLQNALKKGADAADVVCKRSLEITAGIRNGAPETLEQAEAGAVGLRVFCGKAYATLSTSDLSATALERLAENAVAIARQAPEDPFAGLADPTRFATAFPDLEMEDAETPDMASLQLRAKQTEEAARGVQGISNSDGAEAGFSHMALTLLNSHGFHGHYARSMHRLFAKMIAGHGDAMQRDYAFSLATHANRLTSPQAVGEEAGKRTVAKLTPRKITSQTAPIFCEPRITRQLLSHFASAISGAAIARGTSFLKDALNTAVFQASVTITDDPLRPRGPMSRPFDIEGVAARPLALIENGTLTSWLLDSRSACQLGLTTTGHASRGLASSPTPAATNLTLQAGADSAEALYRSVPQGLLVTETFGHGVNVITGDYSLGASGFWLENGERAYPVSEITIAGNLREMFQHLIPANDLEHAFAINGPTVMIPRMTIAGA
jgi:PmbA protein